MLTLLVVDDTQAMRTGLVRTLGVHGFSVVTAENGAEALLLRLDEPNLDK
jgi:CheY-like chemotaxis protein